MTENTASGIVRDEVKKVLIILIPELLNLHRAGRQEQRVLRPGGKLTKLFTAVSYDFS
jgi:hypothetical protein